MKKTFCSLALLSLLLGAAAVQAAPTALRMTTALRTPGDYTRGYNDGLYFVSTNPDFYIESQLDQAQANKEYAQSVGNASQVTYWTGYIDALNQALVHP